jgi:aryl-alcohol dehydrogenase-like predicted oxidoreductase
LIGAEKGEDAMEKRKLGRQGLEVSAIGLGCMGMNFLYGPAGDDAESVATVRLALDLGVDFFDTSQIYGPFTNEELLGRALEGRRDEAVIATKFGFDFRDGQLVGIDSRPETIKAAADAALKRLRTDHIDLFYQHRVDPKVPAEDVAGAVGELVQAGKVRFFGLSEASADRVRRSHAVFPVSALQTEYSVWERGLEDHHIPTLRELGVGLVPYSPLGRGFLTGAIARAEELPEGDFRRTDPRFQGENYDRNMAAAGVVREIAQAHGATPAQVALAWVLAQGDDIVPIPGTKQRGRLRENAGAATLRLTEQDLARLDVDLRPEAVAGKRYTEQALATLDI